MKIGEIRITEAAWPEDRAPIARLMREYVEALEADISFQDFESEYASLPGKYARPEGVVLLAWAADEAVGIVAYRPLERGVCKMQAPLCLAPVSRYGSRSPSGRGAGSRRQITRLSENGGRHLALDAAASSRL